MPLTATVANDTTRLVGGFFEVGMPALTPAPPSPNNQRDTATRGAWTSESAARRAVAHAEIRMSESRRQPS